MEYQLRGLAVAAGSVLGLILLNSTRGWPMLFDALPYAACTGLVAISVVMFTKFSRSKRSPRHYSATWVNAMSGQQIDPGSQNSPDPTGQGRY